MEPPLFLKLRISDMLHHLNNDPIPPSRRILSPFLSAVTSLLIPGLAQILNGQTVKGLCILMVAFAAYSLNLVNTAFFTILLYMIMIISSSDAYFIASRMKLGEEVFPWSILLFDMHASSKSTGTQAVRSMPTLITDAAVIDGTGAPAFQADILLEGGVIRYIRRHIDRKESSYRIVSGSGKLLMPGLISSYSQNENVYFSSQTDTLAVRCGITTEILGGKGLSRAPVSEEHRYEILPLWKNVYGNPGTTPFFSNIGEYLLALDKQIKPVQTESMIGYGTLRANIAGLCTGMPLPEQMEKIRKRIASGAKSGACGVSLNMNHSAGPVVGEEECLQLMQSCAENHLPLSVILDVSPTVHDQQKKMFSAASHKTGAQLLISEDFAANYLQQIGQAFRNDTLSQWVQEHTMAQAARFCLYDRGLIREGMSADLILVKPQNLPDSPDDSPRGLEKVWVKGELQYDTEPAFDASALPRKQIFGIRMN